MITDIYSLDPNDGLYSPGILEIHNDRDILLSQIRMILNTENGEVLGDLNFGGSLEDLLFEFNYNENQIIKKLQDQINAYCDPSPQYSVTLSVKFFQGSVRDGALIDVFINGVKSLGLFVK
jgi:hypothetical protein